MLHRDQVVLAARARHREDLAPEILVPGRRLPLEAQVFLGRDMELGG